MWRYLQTLPSRDQYTRASWSIGRPLGLRPTRVAHVTVAKAYQATKTGGQDKASTGITVCEHWKVSNFYNVPTLRAYKQAADLNQ